MAAPRSGASFDSLARVRTGSEYTGALRRPSEVAH